MEAASRIAKIAWLSVPQIGPQTFRKLVAFCQLEVLDWLTAWQLPAETLGKAGLNRLQLAGLENFKKRFSPPSWVDYLESLQIQPLLEDDAFYPLALKMVPDHPALLFIKGPLIADDEQLVGVVGTRHLTPTGLMATQAIAKALVAYGYPVVSGLMYGADWAAHQTVLAAGGRCVAVLGYGFEAAFQQPQAPYYQELVAANQTLVTQYAPWVGARTGHFPARNRIIAGLSLGIVVTEAGLKSGSHLTAEYARRYQRPVLVIPTTITNAYASAFQALLKQGGQLVISGSDINGIIGDVALKLGYSASPGPWARATVTTPAHWPPSDQGLAQIPAFSARIQQLLSHQPMTTQQLLEVVDCSVTDISVALAHLELAKQIRRQGLVWMCNDEVK